ncbi:hypothetical protein MMF94_31620 [Pseudonocardia alaniniphila]|uniref:Mandelate racemase/muconate lactonizing enzyme C-terminal domain-containing protein n=1 Tax=Pseudonocardia alaniniphila TaxID=75291 RepID=A0ABS9TPG8_9PSEU|nr:enolase C-terminal domain-like protein [Pseudonocardia alaniniphila]MCH6170273.1 hypothetical protein [Pseudonocardia alaniniphila]
MDFTEITGFRVRPVVVPLRRPLRTASGEIPASPLLLIDVTTEGRVTGNSYVFAYTESALPAMVAIAAELEHDLIGRSASPEARLDRLHARFRLLGLPGLLGMVISGVEMALWDALGKRLGAGVASLLGGEPVAVPAYDSFGMVNPAKDAEQLRRSVEAGFRGVKIKLGYPDVEDDLDVVRWARKVVGANTELMVDYNQSLRTQEAERRIERLRDLDVAWIEEPIAAEDLAGHSRLRRLAGGKLQSGENWWFPSGFQTAPARGCERLGDARPGEGRRLHRLAGSCAASRDRLHSREQPYARRGQCSRARRDAHAALARISRYRRTGSAEPAPSC